MKAKAVIIGGGVIGLSLAWHLGRLGWRDVVVVEKGHLNGGATGRCGGGVREQWSSARNIEIMKRSISLFKSLASDTGENVWFRQGGYLFLAKNDSHVAQLETSVKLQNEHGSPTRMMTLGEIHRLCPYLNTDDVLAGSFNPNDGVLFPFSVVHAFAKGIKKHGNSLITHNPVTNIEIQSGKIRRVATDQVEIETSIIVNAAGTWAPAIGAMAGVDLPNYPEKHEALVTESLRPFLGPNLVPMDSGLFVSQTMRGEIYACLGVEKGPAEDYRSSFKFISAVSRAMIDLMPRLSAVKVLRQWGGYYDITPDTNPILGPVEGVEGFIQCHGFMGHGFMMAPAIGEIMAEFLVHEKIHPEIENCRLSRFQSGGLVAEKMIIG
jgi:glycine/D-amino acid oxidase-like deaminating enzyme